MDTDPNPFGGFRGLATLIGRVTIAWNQAHYFLFKVFVALQVRPEVEFAHAVFFALKSDRAQRDVTLSVAMAVLHNADLRNEARLAITALNKLAERRNDVTHAMWGNPNGEDMMWVPHTRLSQKDITLELHQLEKDIHAATLNLVSFVEKLVEHMSQRRHSSGALIAPPGSVDP